MLGLFGTRSVSQREFANIPLEALSDRTRKQLETMLNQRMSYFRDWRGALEVIGFPEQYHTLVASHANPTGYLMELWAKKSTYCKRPPNLAELQTVLALIERLDIVDDTSKMIQEDANEFLWRQQMDHMNQYPFVLPDTDIITKDDTQEHKQKYDAFMLFADQDVVFASETIEHLENSGIRLCLLDRDVLAGRNSVQEVLSLLISKRCRRLVVIISQAFLESPMNSFAASFAAACKNEHRQSKMIPCLIESIKVPSCFKYFSLLYYSRDHELYSFWDKLRCLIRGSED